MPKISLVWFAATALLILALSFGAFSIPAAASPLAQATALPLPTPDETGRILYTVQSGDSPFLIAAKFQLDINQLNILNNWTGDTVLQVGQVVILGLATTPQATGEATPTPSGSPTPEAGGTGTICVLLYEDLNGDALRQETEFGIQGGAVSVTERTGLASQSQTTLSLIDADGLPIANCFEDLPAGEYNITVAVPEGYNPTTVMTITIDLGPGDATNLNFGAQLSSDAQAGDLAPGEGGRSPLMGLLGVVMLVSGLGLGYYNLQGRRRR